jgi:predicted metal-binding membrane protein
MAPCTAPRPDALLGFAADGLLLWLLEHWDWLALHAWAVGVGALLLAGGYELSPAKQQAIIACRRFSEPGVADGRAWWRAGLNHGCACVRAEWALMVVMFGIGMTNLGWMIALTGIMLAEQMAPRLPGTTKLVGGLMLMLGYCGWSTLSTA